MKRFEGQIVMVTGASRGIGMATAERFAAEGAHVILLANNADELKRTAGQFENQGYPVLPLCVDISDPNQVEDAIEQAVSILGRIDVLVNNAGIAWEEPFLDITDAHWQQMINVNLNGMFYVAQRVSRQMVKQMSGCILNMGSTNGLAGEENYAHYNASKGGVVLLTKTMALELGRYNIRVNAVCPGYIQTPLTESIDDAEFVGSYIRNKIPLGKVGKVEDVAGVFAFLASEDAAFITGESIVVDGGQLA
ncbi:SDR family NAD(P)-dependent oxidoreductase [Paenibacillus eucommiae]|uniref:3-oxoacyl-[acyl-carrier protein] reductase n=1 Tax=Paenibacillus eucommiae TaxID=1355755 RepID=A0ABS4J087_9BACL|nr:SDR family NAD(P)-dependent oxidoreductase [Paenibacillus eucommiae]MBP1992740.1 3-oxoacyl-[acyl-carrier protein] reductase [Paenibacillus eucommiae]